MIYAIVQSDNTVRVFIPAPNIDMATEQAQNGEQVIEFTGQPRTGGILQNGEIIFPDPPLDQLKKGAWYNARSYRDRFIADLLTTITDKGVWDYDDQSRTNIQDAITAAIKLGSNAPATKLWRMHDNSMVSVTVQDLQNADLAGIMSKDACYQNSWSIEASIDAATTASEIAAIDVTAGYPS